MIAIFAFILALIVPFTSLNITALAADDSNKYILPTDKTDSGKTFAYYTSVTWKGGPQYAVLNSGTYKGKSYNTTTDKSTGIRMVGDYYCAAVGTYFSKGAYKGYGIGSKFIVKTSSGKTFKIIRCDTKANKDTDSKYHLWHKDSFNSVIEFYVDKKKIPDVVNRSGNYATLPQFKGSIVSVTPVGKASPSTDGSSDSDDTVEDDDTGDIVYDQNLTCTANIVYRLIYNKKPKDNVNNLNDIPITDTSSLSYVSKSKMQTKKTLNDDIANIVKYVEENTDSGTDTDIVEPIIPPSAGGSDFLTTGYLGKPVPVIKWSCSGLYYSSGKWHGGNDISCSVGTTVYAMDGGTVVDTGVITCNGKCGRAYHSGGKAPNGKYYCSYGTYIKIKHPTTKGTYYTLYAHLSQVDVKIGDVVMKGTPIGKSGNRGNSSGAHLHIELRKNGGSNNTVGNVLCPSDYIDKDKSYAGK